MYGPAAPLPMFAGDAAERRGAALRRYEWPADPPLPNDPSVQVWVADAVTAELDEIDDDDVLLVAKSLGTNAAGVAAARGLPAVWLTPLLVMPWVVAAMEAASAPFLLVGGTADPAWDGDVARRLTPHVLEVPEADHGMYVPGPLVDSVAVLAEVVTAVEGFLDAIDWPGVRR